MELKTPLLGLPLTLEGLLKFRLTTPRLRGQTREERDEIEDWANGPALTSEEFRKQFDIITIKKDYLDMTYVDVPGSYAFGMYKSHEVPSHSFRFDLSTCTEKPQGLYQYYIFPSPEREPYYRVAVIDPDGYIIPTRSCVMTYCDDSWTSKHAETKDMIILTASHCRNSFFTRYSMNDALTPLPSLTAWAINPIYRNGETLFYRM